MTRTKKFLSGNTTSFTIGILKKRKEYLKSLLPNDAIVKCCCEDGTVNRDSSLGADDPDGISETPSNIPQCGLTDPLEVIVMNSEDGRPLLSKIARKIAVDRKSSDLNFKLLMEYIQKGTNAASP